MSTNSTLYILVIVLGFAFLFLFLTPSKSYVPYNNQPQTYSTYEPLTEMLSNEDEEEKENFDHDSKEDEEKENFDPDSKEDEEKENFEPDSNEDEEKEKFEPDSKEDDEKENFEPIINVPQTIHYGPFRDSLIIDKFSQITKNGIDGVDGCVSSGLSNSGGYICLSPELIKLLKTRGGNASGGEYLSSK